MPNEKSNKKPPMDLYVGAGGGKGLTVRLRWNGRCKIPPATPAKIVFILCLFGHVTVGGVLAGLGLI
jgi:hypothetical protein